MRDALVPYLGQRIVVQATVLRHSRRVGWAGIREATILLGQVTTVDGTLLTDHHWMDLGRRFAALDLHLGDAVEFSARVATYRRGLKRMPGEPVTFTTDYGLAYPTRCQVLTRAPQEVQAAPNPDSVPTAKARVLASVYAFWQAEQEPPSLPRICHISGLNPSAVITQLHHLAKSGAVRFTSEGRIFIPTHLLTSDQYQEVYA